MSDHRIQTLLSVSPVSITIGGRTLKKDGHASVQCSCGWKTATATERGARRAFAHHAKKEAAHG